MPPKIKKKLVNAITMGVLLLLLPQYSTKFLLLMKNCIMIKTLLKWNVSKRVYAVESGGNFYLWVEGVEITDDRYSVESFDENWI